MTIDFANFTPIASLIGGLLIGLSASLIMLFKGRVMGISGIVGGILQPAQGEWGWRLAFLGGLLAGGVGVLAVSPELVSSPSTRSLVAVGVAGLFVGVGTRLGNGCTSGHGVCGLTRFSARSLVAVLTFITTGAIAVLVAPMISAFGQG